MPLTPSQKPTREWPLLIFTVAAVSLICFPLWQSFASADADSAGWSPQRWAQLLLGPEQIACYACSLWSFLIFLSRYWETLRQRKAFSLGLLPTDEGSRILQEDARPLQRKIDQSTQSYGPFILANMIRAALGKFALSKSSHDVRESVKAQAEADLGRLVSSMATMNYLAWAVPAIGFFGTVRGKCVTALYDNDMAYTAFGYPGSAWEKGGYITRGFQDLKWLPEPTKSASPKVWMG